MKYTALFAALAASALAPTARAQVGVAVNIGEPGFFGRIEIGSAPPPRLIYRSPVIVDGGPGGDGRAPVYLHVPPGYEKHWRKHCAEYNACGQRVLFVRDDWYRNRYVPHYREHRGEYEHRDGDRRDEREGPDRRDDRHDQGDRRDREDHHDHDRPRG